jgi:mRNA interferase RelE/StbE
MEVAIARSFIKDMKAAPKPVQMAVDETIRKLIQASSLQTSGVDYRKLEGQRKGESYYRIRIGDWRIGIECTHPNVIVLRLLIRGAVYQHFPPR